jgi:hypothetical protein
MVELPRPADHRVGSAGLRERLAPAAKPRTQLAFRERAMVEAGDALRRIDPRHDDAHPAVAELEDVSRAAWAAPPSSSMLTELMPRSAGWSTSTIGSRRFISARLASSAVRQE